MMKLRPYPEYKDSGVEWLGEVPGHWETRKLGRISTRITKGTTPTTWGRDFVESGTRFVKVESISKNRSLIHDRCAFIDSETDVLLARSRLQNGDVLVAIAGAIGRVAVVRDHDLPANTNQAVGIISSKQDRLAPDWLSFILSSVPCQQYFSDSTVQSAQANLSLGNLARTMVPVPSLEEQNLITDFLTLKTRLINRFMRNKRRLIKLLQEQKQAVINDCVTGKMEVRRIVDENGNSSFRLQPSSCKMRDSGIDWLGEIPEHWAVIPLRWNISISSGESIATERLSSEQSSNSPYSVVGGNGKLGYTNVSNIHSMTIVLGRVGALCGNVHLIESPAWITDNALRITRVDKFSHEYLSKQLETMNLNRLANRSAQPLITGGMVKAQKVALPPLEEQSMIIERCREVSILIDKFISRAQRQIDLIQEYRTRLIADVVTGKVDVRGIPVEDVPEDEALEELVDEMDEALLDDDEYAEEA